MLSILDYVEEVSHDAYIHFCNEVWKDIIGVDMFKHTCVKDVDDTDRMYIACTHPIYASGLEALEEILIEKFRVRDIHIHSFLFRVDPYCFRGEV